MTDVKAFTYTYVVLVFMSCVNAMQRTKYNERLLCLVLVFLYYEFT